MPSVFPSQISALRAAATASTVPQGKSYVTAAVSAKEAAFPAVFSFKTPPTVADVEYSVYALRGEIRSHLKSSGAVLLRGFLANEACTAESFALTMDSMGWAQYHYIGGAAPRTPVVGTKVFTTNESPPSEPVPFHHELGQVEKPPSYIAFFCEQPAQQGGETPIVYSPAVCEFVKNTYPEVAAKLKEHGVKYLRVMPEITDNTSAIGRSWKETFSVETRAECEKRLVAMGYEFEWVPGTESGKFDLVTITKALPAFVHVEGRESFRNAIVAAFKGWTDARNDPSKAVKYGDGSPFEPEVMTAISDFMDKERVSMPWQRGDILLLNNDLVMHSRLPFETNSKRRVLASLWGPELGCPVNEVLPNSKQPKVGFGFWKVPKEDAARTAVRAIAQGYRHLDNACDYGNEKEVGEGIRIATQELGLCTREELYVVSKLWNTFHKGEHVEMAFRKSLEDLGCGYLDLYLIHFPISMEFVPIETLYPPEWINPETKKMTLSPVPLHETWAAMEKLVTDLKLCRHIGLANHNCQSVRDLLSYCKVKPAALQVELHPYNTQEKLLRFCSDNSIDVTGFSPLGAGSYLVLNDSLSSQKDSVLESETVQALLANSTNYAGRTPAQLVLGWGVQRGTAVIPKCSSVDRMKENLDLFARESKLKSGGDPDPRRLLEKDMEEISGLNKGRRFNDPGDFCEGMGQFCPIYE